MVVMCHHVPSQVFWPTGSPCEFIWKVAAVDPTPLTGDKPKLLAMKFKHS